MTPGVRFEWGERGAAALAPGSDVVVIVDVLSFTTAVEVAVGRGASVHPTAEDDERTAAIAMRVGGIVAVRRGQTTAAAPFSLSPGSLTDIPAGTVLVLPSPNGSRISAAVAGGPALVVAGSLRNASAVAADLRARGGRISVVACGERWPDDSLRPALEDAIGAGAILARLGRTDLSPEARAAVSVYERMGAAGLAGCVSADELEQAGWAEDVRLAMEEDAGGAVPVLVDGAFRNAS
ncbi:MAG: 2-phosphosulfolactate phosphatase [Gaiellales bacterium]